MRIFFAYVCQYLYTGDYSIPLPSDVVPYHIAEEEQYEQSHIPMLEGNIFKNLVSVKKVADYTVRRILPRPALPSNGHHYHYFWNYSKSLLAHAQLSVFAEQSGLEELRDIQDPSFLRSSQQYILIPAVMDSLGIESGRAKDFALAPRLSYSLRQDHTVDD